MRWFLSLLALLASFALGADYRADPKLAKPISLRLKIVSLSECVKAIRDQTSVGIYVSPNIEDRKVTVVFKDRPAAEAMEMIAKTLFCQWSSEAGGYRLEMLREAVNEETGLLAAEEDVLRDRIEATVKQLAELGKTPRDDLVVERDRINADIERLPYSRDPADKKHVDELRKQSSKFSLLYWWDIGYAFGRGKDTVSQLTAGSTVFASTDEQSVLPLPASSIPQFRARVVVMGDDGKPHEEVKTSTGAIAPIRCNSVTGMLEVKVLGTGIMPAAGGTSRSLPILNTGEAESKLYNAPLRKRLRDWARTLDTSILARKISGESHSSPGYTAKAFTIAEHLEHLADSAGISVVADAYRLPASSEGYLSGQTVGDYTRQLRDETTPEVRGGFFRTERGWLMYRHGRFWRQVAAEIPEKLWNKIESRPADRLGLDDYVAFASSLSPWQAQVFPYRPSLSRFPRLPLIDAMPALRLWGSLSAEQRQIAYRSGLPASALSGTQLDLYRFAANEIMWRTGANEVFVQYLMKGTGAGELGLFMRDAKTGARPWGAPDEQQSGQQSNYSPEALKPYEAGTFDFILGTSMEAGGGTYNVKLLRGGW